MLVFSLFLFIVSATIKPSFTCWYTSYINGTRYRNAVMGYNNTQSIIASLGVIDRNNNSILSIQDESALFTYFSGYHPTAFYVEKATFLQWRVSETVVSTYTDLTLLDSSTSCYNVFNQSCVVDTIGIPNFCEDSFFCNGQEQCAPTTKLCVYSSLTPCGISTQCSEQYLNCTDIVFTNSPTRTPTNNPTPAPTYAPSIAPTNSPTKVPIFAPTNNPTESPTFEHTNTPTINSPTQAPTNTPTNAPTNNPTLAPTIAPTNSPTEAPTSEPTTNSPTEAPTNTPTLAPTIAPTNSPTEAPTSAPTTHSPTEAPTSAPTNSPTSAPTQAPTFSPTSAHTNSPTLAPTFAPTSTPTNSPTAVPTPNATYPSTPCRNNSDCRVRRVALFCGVNGFCKRLRCEVDNDCPQRPFGNDKCFGTICIERGNARICVPTKCDQACLPNQGCPTNMTTTLVPIEGTPDVDTESVTLRPPSFHGTDSTLATFMILFAVLIVGSVTLLFIFNAFSDNSRTKKAPRSRLR